jgi:hypothetical protein
LRHKTNFAITFVCASCAFCAFLWIGIIRADLRSSAAN